MTDAVTPEDVAATAQDEADTGYTITPPPLPDADHEEPAKPEFDSAFLVVVRHDGSAFATADLESKCVVDRTADLALMARACTEVLSDIETTKISQNVLALMMQQGQAAQEQAEQERVRQALASKGIDVGRVHRRR